MRKKGWRNDVEKSLIWEEKKRARAQKNLEDIAKEARELHERGVVLDSKNTSALRAVFTQVKSHGIERGLNWAGFVAKYVGQDAHYLLMSKGKTPKQVHEEIMDELFRADNLLQTANRGTAAKFKKLLIGHFVPRDWNWSTYITQHFRRGRFSENLWRYATPQRRGAEKFLPGYSAMKVGGLERELKRLWELEKNIDSSTEEGKGRREESKQRSIAAEIVLAEKKRGIEWSGSVGMPVHETETEPDVKAGGKTRTPRQQRRKKREEPSAKRTRAGPRTRKEVRRKPDQTGKLAIDLAQKHSVQDLEALAEKARQRRQAVRLSDKGVRLRAELEKISTGNKSAEIDRLNLVREGLRKEQYEFEKKTAPLNQAVAAIEQAIELRKGTG